MVLIGGGCILIACDSTSNSTSTLHDSSSKTPQKKSRPTHIKMIKTAQQTDSPPPLSPPTWLFVGDSLTAGFGVATDQSYVSYLRDLLKKEGHTVQIRGAGVSGDTSAGVKRRIDWLLRQPVHTVFLCIGANDGLRGQPIEVMKSNIISIIQSIQKKGTQAVLIGMKISPNYGVDYTQAFERAYAQVAEELKVPFLPFLLEDIAGDPAFNLQDGIHPNPKGHEKVAQHVHRFIKEAQLIKTLPSLAAP